MFTKLLPFVLILASGLALPLRGADIYLVRHAEKVGDGSKDPALTPEGAQRATHLAVLLKSAGIARVFSTDYRRTRSTAQPTADIAGVGIEVYDPDALEVVARDLLTLDSNALVVGHSNTTPELVELMGGEGGPPIVEEWEYDRVYLVQTERGQVTHTILFHLPPSKVPADSSDPSE